MLRNTHVFRVGLLPFPARAAMIGVLALLGLAVAGLRGPSGATQSQADDRPGKRCTQVPRKTGPRGSASTFDLSLLPAETKMVLALQPALLLEARGTQIARSLDSIGHQPQGSFCDPA